MESPAPISISQDATALATGSILSAEDRAAHTPREVPPDLAEQLRCPVTQTGLRWMGGSELANLNAAAASEKAVHLDGSAVDGAVSAALVNDEGSIAYRMDDGILMMLPISAIAMDAPALARYGKKHRAEKVAIKSFYDQIGWKRDEKGDFEDAVIWEDLRPVSADYIHKCHLRVNRYLKPTGNYLLDVASGPVQYDEYLTYSQGYRRRICMDISITALREARRKVGEKGVYILGDITNLPLQSGSMDAVVSLHTIYHVPQDEQASAFEELYRVLKPGRSGAVVYTFTEPPLERLGVKPARFWNVARHSFAARIVKRLLRRRPGPPKPPQRTGAGTSSFYFQDHKLDWFESRQWSFPLEIVVWRSINVWFMRTYVHPRRFGKLLLSLIYRLEEWFPRYTGRKGPYPMFVLRK